jgi:hypothetical protein
MGYIKKVVDTGLEYADHYQMPQYVAKARTSSKIIDVASEKICELYCEKGSPLLKKVDELTTPKIGIALEIANSKVEQAQTLKTTAAAKVTEKTTEAIEMAKKTKATAYEKTIVVKQDGLAKYQQLKLLSSKKVDETKTIMRKRVIYATEEACRFEQALEQKLKEQASKNQYADKVLSVFMKVKEEVQMYGDAFVKKSLSLPLTLKERMAEKLILAKIKVRTGSVYVEAKSAELISKAKKSYASYYAKVTTDNALSAISTMFGEKAGAFTAEKLQLIKRRICPAKSTRR